MSDEEMFDDVNDEIEDDDDEYDVMIKQELIALVQANPALYAKNWKEYCGKNFCKDLAWESIGSSLSKQMSGKDAAKAWYNIRQRFGKERRKVLVSLKGKSGQGTKPLYVPKWQFYNLCLFLADHIMPRKTTSNYMPKKNVKKTTTIGKRSLPSVFILPSSSTSLPSLPLSTTSLPLRSTPSPQTPSPQPLSPQPLSPQALSPQTPSPQPLSPQAPSAQASVLLSPSSIWTISDLESSNDTTSVFSMENNKETEVLPPSCVSNSLNMEEYFPASVTPSASEKALKTIKKISTSTKRIVPEPDNFAKRKKKDEILFMQAMTKQSTALTSFATKLGESLTNSSQNSSTFSSVSSMDNPILTAIAYALKSVPEEKHLECMVELLQVIKSKYVQ